MAGGCVAMWLCGHVAVWPCGCVAMWLCGYVAMWLCGCVAVWLCVATAAVPHPRWRFDIVSPDRRIATAIYGVLDECYRFVHRGDPTLVRELSDDVCGELLSRPPSAFSRTQPVVPDPWRSAHV